MGLTQTLWLPGRFPGLNEIIAAAKGAGGRGFAYAKLKRDMGERVWLYAKSARLQPVARGHFAFLWIEKDRRRDPDNVAAGGRKLIFDGLVKAAVIPGDGWAAIAGWSDAFEVGPGHGVRVTITEYAESQTQFPHAKATGTKSEPTQ